ncbi:MAG TPA: hypothetical protein VMV69_15095 [Pirellulales bacterium]|nr:hypothetical protein [Pirellulales bacterium]
MSQEIVYTSAPRGLKPGTRGFCTVISTQGMVQPLAERLESLSGYRQVFAADDPQAALNPVNFSHLAIAVGGRRFHVLSRVADAGLDYTQRSNKFAHLVALEPNELTPAGPAWVMSQPGFLETAWDGEPRLLRAGRTPPAGATAAAVCSHWQQVTGDAGWGGVLAETALSRPPRPVCLLFQPGQDLLPLVAEALALLPAERRWQVTFSTYFTKLPPGVECQWRFVLADGPEAKAAVRLPHALVLDLRRPLPAAEGGPLVAAARTGVLPMPAAPPRRAPAQESRAPAGNVDEPAASKLLTLLAEPEPSEYDVAPAFPSIAGVNFPQRGLPPLPRKRKKKLLVWSAVGSTAALVLIGGGVVAVHLRTAQRRNDDESVAASQPTASQPTASQPTASQPTANQPTASQPTASQPSASQPSASQPSASQPRASRASQPSASQPSASQPSASQPTPSHPLPPAPTISAAPPARVEPPALLQPTEPGGRALLEKGQYRLQLPEYTKPANWVDVAKIDRSEFDGFDLDLVEWDTVVEPGDQLKLVNRHNGNIKEWEISQGVDNSVAVSTTVGKFRLKEDSLQFLWGGKDYSALRNCVLKISAGKAAPTICYLRTPVALPRAALDFKKPERDIAVDLLGPIQTKLLRLRVSAEDIAGVTLRPKTGLAACEPKNSEKAKVEIHVPFEPQRDIRVLVSLAFTGNALKIRLSNRGVQTTWRQGKEELELVHLSISKCRGLASENDKKTRKDAKDLENVEKELKNLENIEKERKNLQIPPMGKADPNAKERTRLTNDVQKLTMRKNFHEKEAAWCEKLADFLEKLSGSIRFTLYYQVGDYEVVLAETPDE